MKVRIFLCTIAKLGDPLNRTSDMTFLFCNKQDFKIILIVFLPYLVIGITLFKLCSLGDNSNNFVLVLGNQLVFTTFHMADRQFRSEFLIIDHIWVFPPDYPLVVSMMLVAL